VEVARYANTREEEVNAKTVEVLVYANIKDKEVTAKNVEVLLQRKTEFMCSI
jgi:hypothetical protein